MYLDFEMESSRTPSFRLSVQNLKTGFVSKVGLDVAAERKRESRKPGKLMKQRQRKRLGSLVDLSDAGNFRC